MGGGVSTNHKSSNRIELSWFSQQFLNFECFDLIPPINPPTQPPTHQTIHPPMGGEVFTDFKSSNGIEISRLVQLLLHFDWFWGSPPGGWGVGGWGWGWWEGTPHTCAHAHACMHMHVWHIREFPGIPPMGAAICMKLSCLTRVRACACVCVHVHMCRGHLLTTPQPPSIHPPPPEPQGAQNTKIQ